MSQDAKTRTLWADLPADVIATVESVLGGRVVTAESQAEGFSPGSADRVVTHEGRRAFVKAVHRARNEGAYDLHRREIDVLRRLPAGVSAPALLGRHVSEDWVALIVEDVAGRHPGASGDGSDVVAVLDAFASFPRLDDEAKVGLPDVAEEFSAERDSWAVLDADGIAVSDWADSSRARLRTAAERVADVVRGDYLQHLDGRADNVLIDPHGTAWVIDWPWAGYGARWVDGLLYLLDARFRGENVDAEHLLDSHPLFDDVAPTDVDSVLAGVAGRMFDKARLPAPPNMPTLRDFQRRQGVAALLWLQERWG